MKKYNLGKIEIDGEEQVIFLRDDLKLLHLKDVENLLNTQDESLSEMIAIRKRNDSLTTRVSKLRNELEEARSHQADDHTAKEICRILQDRINFVDNEPVAYHVAKHLETVKDQLIKEGLWRR